MKPFDLPPDNAPDALRADLCRPAEMREHESYLSKPADGDVRDHEDAPPTQPPTPPPPPLPPGQQMLVVPRWWEWYEEQHRQAIRAAGLLYRHAPLPLVAAALDAATDATAAGMRR